MATKHLSIAEAFDINHDIRDFCTERGKGLTTINPSTVSLDTTPSIITTPTTNNTLNNEKHNSLMPTSTSTTSLPRERSSTSISNESHRSNKCKSVIFSQVYFNLF
jgi:hypothetical protein